MVKKTSKQLATITDIARDNLDYSPFSDKGGLPKAWGLFENELDTMIIELNRELVA